MADRKPIEISNPVKWVLAIAIGSGLIAAYKKIAPVARIAVKNYPKKYRKFAVGFGKYKWYKQFVPSNLASDLKVCMTGATTSDPCLEYWKKILKLNQNEIRGLHNAWHRTIDNRLSLYDWIKAEDTSTPTQYKTKLEILKRFNMSGVGERNQILPPKEIYPFADYSDSIAADA